MNVLPCSSHHPSQLKYEWKYAITATLTAQLALSNLISSALEKITISGGSQNDASSYSEKLEKEIESVAGHVGKEVQVQSFKETPPCLHLTQTV